MKKGPPLLEPPAPTWREHAAAAGIFAAFFLLLFARTLTALRAGAEVLPGDPGGDLPNYFYYARRFFGESLRHGEFPLWNPYLMAGLPFVGTIQSATLYPWNWLHAAAPPAAWIALTLWAHMTLGAWAMWLLCRRLGATTLGALFGGLTYGASGFAAAHLYAGHVTYLCAMAWTPLVLGQFESASRNLTSRRSILGGWAFGAQILAGAPQISAMTAGALAFLAAARSVEGWKREGRRGPLASWASAATIVGIGAGIAAAQILPGARFLRGSFRGGPLNPEAAAFSSMPVENLLQLAFPQFLGTVNGGRYWGRGYPWEVFGWAGILAPAGACVGVTARTPTRGTARWYAAMALGGLVFALGPATPLYPALCRVAPVLGRMNVPGRFVFLWTLGLSVAAGLGWSALFAPGAEAAALRRLWSIRWIKAALLGLFVLAALFAVEGGDSDAWKGLAQREAEAQDALMTNWKGKEDSRAFAAWRRATFANSMADCVGGVGLLLLAAGAVGAASKSGGRKAAAFGAFAFLIQAGDLLRVGGDMAAPAPMRPAVWDESLADEIRQSGGRVETSATLPKVGPSALNRGMIERIPMVWGYEPGAPRRFVELANASQDVSLLRFNPFLSVRGTGPIQDLLGARWRVDKPAAQGAPADGPAKRDYGFFAIYENPDAMPRAWVAPRGENAGAWSSILLALTSGKARPRETALFEEAPPQAPPGSATGARAESAPATGAARIAAESANRVAVDYDAAAGGFLVLADRWDSGWRATVNGRNVPLLRAFGVLRAVPVEAGTGQVVFVYRPWDFYLGLVVSLGSMVFLLTWRPLFKTLFRRIRKRIDHAVAKV